MSGPERRDARPWDRVLDAPWASKALAAVLLCGLPWGWGCGPKVPSAPAVQAEAKATAEAAATDPSKHPSQDRAKAETFEVAPNGTAPVRSSAATATTAVAVTAGQAVTSSVTLASSPGPQGSKPEGKDPRGKIVVPENASEGPRELDKVGAVFQKLATSQPYGRAWKDVVHVGAQPKDTKELGKADTHPALANDPIEVQQQVQFLEETGTEARFGFVSIRGVRVWRYGKLAALRIVLDRIPEPGASGDKFKADIETIGAAWKNVPAALSLGAGFKMVKNDLIEQKATKPAEYPKAPLSIELVPMERGGR